MSVETKLLVKLVKVLKNLEDDANEKSGWIDEEWGTGVVYAVDTIRDELGITKDALTGEYKIDI